MSDAPITFNDGAAYERFMGRWSALVGEVFLDWLAPRKGLRWIDVGCGNGAFTELLLTRAAAAEVDGVDPSEEQLAFARTRLAGRPASFQLGSATALPFPDSAFDAAVMALVIFFVPVPEKGVAEMVRVTKPGGQVCAYAWDIMGGGFPTEIARDVLRDFGIEPRRPPRPEVSTIPALEGLWRDAGLENIVTREIEVERSFADFDEWWTSVRGAPTLAALIDAMPGEEVSHLRDALRRKLTPAAGGGIRYPARANAISGTRPRS